MTLKQQIAEILKASNYYGIPGDTLAESISKLESLIESEAVEFGEWLNEKYEHIISGTKKGLYYEKPFREGERKYFTTAELYKLKSKQDGK